MVSGHEPLPWGHFTLHERVGAGTSGEVWRGWDTLLHRDVAIKFLQDTARRDTRTLLLREARALACVRHPNVVSVYGIAEMDGRTGMWMELLGGATLQAEMNRRGALLSTEVATIGAQIAAALESLGEAGLVHRDIKPGNIVLEPNGRAVLTDFGLGTKWIAGSLDVRRAGTPMFMAPSLLEGGEPSPRTDLYALGVTLRWALTGAAPFDARSLEELRAEAARGPSRRLPEESPQAPPSLIEAIENAMRVPPDPEWNAARMCECLERIVERSPRSAGMPRRRASDISVAVLPFRNRGSDTDDYFSDGLADELIATLSKVRGLRVAARTSSFSFKGKREQPVAIGHALKVGAILEGSATRSGDRVSIEASLVDVATGLRIWSEAYDRTLDDMFTVQDDLARAVAGSLRDAFETSGYLPDPDLALGRGRGSNPEVHRLYLEARHIATLGGSDHVTKALERMLEVVAREPSHALAWAWLGRAHATVASISDSAEERDQGLERSMLAARRAIELEPELPDGHAALGMYLTRFRWDWTGGDTCFRRALALAPSHADALRSAGTLARGLGRDDVALDLHRRVLDLDPLNPTSHLSLAHSYRVVGRLDEAERAYRQAIDMAPRRVAARSCLALLYLTRGDTEAALVEAELESAPPIRLFVCAVVHHAAGRTAESNAALGELTERYSVVAPYQIAQVHAARGEADPAFLWLDRACELRDAGVGDVGWETVFRPVHGDPRWISFLRRMGLRNQAR